MHPQIIHCAVGATIAAIVAIYAATRSERSPARRLITSLLASLFVLNVAMGAQRLIDDPTGSRIALAVYLAAALSLPSLWVLIAAHLTRCVDPDRYRPRTQWLALGVPPLLFYLGAMTNDLHHLHFRAVDGPQVPVLKMAGPLLWATAAWSWTLIFAGFAMYLRKAVQLAVRGEIGRGVLLAAVTLLPLPINIADSMGLFGVHSGFTQSSSAIAVGLLFLLSWRYRLQETLPLARRDVIEHLFDGVIIADQRGAILDLNPAAERITGMRARESRGMQLQQLFEKLRPKDEDRSFRKAVDDVANSRGPWFHHFRDREGRLLEVTTAARWEADCDTPTGWFVVLRDQTERRRLEHLLRQSQRLETISGLAAGIAHEVNNPLAYVRSNLNHIESLADELEKELPRSEVLAEIREVAAESLGGIDRIAGIVERMRRFSRIQGDTLERIEVDQLVEDTLRLASLHRSDSIGLSTDLQATGTLIQGSPEHLVQALLNLVSHAKQRAAERDGGQVRIETRCFDGIVEIVVEHNGRPLGDGDRSQLFDPFSGDDNQDGAGVALAVAFGIIREHYGVLELDSPPLGTRFRIRIPVNES